MKKGRKRVDLSVFTEEQILEIIRFYGIETIKNEIRFDSKSPFERKIRENFERYIY